MQSIQDARDTLNTFISAHFTIMSLERIGVFLIFTALPLPPSQPSLAVRYFSTHAQFCININDMESKQISYSLLKMSRTKSFAGTVVCKSAMLCARGGTKRTMQDSKVAALHVKTTCSLPLFRGACHSFLFSWCYCVLFYCRHVLMTQSHTSWIM